MPSMLITGASAGIGAETARSAAAAGFDLALNYRSNRDAATSLAASARATGRQAVLVPGDVGVEADVQAMFAAHNAAFGPPDAVINNAGIVPPRGRALADATADEMAEVIRINVMGALLVAREAVRAMSRARGGQGGVLVNISSAAARRGGPGEYVDYAASKGAVDTLTTGLAAEHAGDGIRVVGIRPGLIETGIHAKGGDAGRLDRLAPSVPMGRAGTVREIADVVLFLVSDSASYMTGCTIDVSGGR
ncbi:MAG: SDR family oxidoreductase [Pseudomonadota bacterium]